MSADRESAPGHGSEHRWIRHADFYVPPGEVPGQPTSAPADHELRRGQWGWVRRAASWPLVLFIRLWRRLISPLYGQVCTFYPSCSAYGLEAVTVHGLLRGAGLTGWRILRCNPWSGGGVDQVPASSRIWPQDGVPEIVRINHPPMPTSPSWITESTNEQHDDGDSDP